MLTIATLIFATLLFDARGNVNDRRAVGHGQVRFDGHGPEWWAQQARRYKRALRDSRRTLLERTSTAEAIQLACVTYRVPCSTLWRKARCETGGTFSPLAWNPTPIGSEHASGLFQFLPSTFRSTPYGRFSIFDPVANALAAGWMHAHGRGGEWACQ